MGLELPPAGFSIHWPVEGTEIEGIAEGVMGLKGFSIHWPVEGTEMLAKGVSDVIESGFSIHWPVEGTEMRNSEPVGKFRCALLNPLARRGY